jgi:hypothetical protein
VTVGLHYLALAAVLVVVAIVLLFLFGPLSLLILVVAGAVLWYAAGPGSHGVAVNFSE